MTAGDPAGIGPEIVVRAVARRLEQSAGGAPLRLYGDPAWFERTAGAIGLDWAGLTRSAGSALTLDACAPVPGDLQLGRLDARAGDAAYRAVRRAALDAVAGRVRAVVTAPLNKAALNMAGHDYPGHTELLAEIAGGVPVRMMLANDELRTILVTIHLPLRDAIAALDLSSILVTIRLIDAFLRRSGIERPRIAVAGLNPHAGEGGLLGREEIDLIAPAIERARRDGIDASGPHPPDTVFMRARGFTIYDVVVAMYHDQGLIPVKYLGLDDGVNITVGLPFVRTSPDHGTAFDIAAKRQADPRSLLAAIRFAEQLSAAATAVPAHRPTTRPQDRR